MRLALCVLAVLIAAGQTLANPASAAPARGSSVKALILQPSDLPSNLGKFKLTVSEPIASLSKLKLSKKQAALAAKEGLVGGALSELMSTKKANFASIVDEVYVFKNSDGSRWLMSLSKKSVAKSLKTPMKPISGIGDSALGLTVAKTGIGEIVFVRGRYLAIVAAVSPLQKNSPLAKSAPTLAKILDQKLKRLS